ncbi:MAG: hypothetical protein UT01_C0062G0007 [Candidatus Daviesbacteria bacterium GW2011_GWA1_38_7]|nr:MAG: hypothetical protein UT01_C0062G0007 [Candidatus Daviesbacteria bacterium GW2011_GWA1_38_7]
MHIKNKKGELTTTQLVTIIVLIVSFVVILFLIFRLNLGQITDAEICKNSVALRGRTAGFSGPLDCKTQYVCISGGENCVNFSSTEEITVDQENKTKIMAAVADKMAGCWSIFGEGKINYGDSGKEAGYATCSVCSIMKFDPTLQNNEKISYQEFYNYLKTTKKTDSQTYLQYLYSTNDFSSLTQEYLANSLEFGKPYFILTGIRREGIWNYVFSLDFFIDSESQPVIIFENTPENYDKIGCNEFVTKA